MKLIIDSDVISHFIRAGQIIHLPSIFKTKILMFDIVFKELEKWYTKRIQVDNLIRYKLIEVIPFPEDDKIAEEFFHIKKLRFYGDGEAACMAYAKFTQNIVASNNLKDIKNYCTLHNIEYVTTLDFLQRALEKGILTEDQCNQFISDNITPGFNPFPVSNILDYSGNDISHIP